MYYFIAKPQADALSNSTTMRTPRASSVRPTPSAPSITTFRSRTGRKFRTTTESANVFARRSDDAVSETNNSLLENEATASDSRALELLRSLYTIAAKWGWEAAQSTTDRNYARIGRLARWRISLEYQKTSTCQYVGVDHCSVTLQRVTPSSINSRVHSPNDESVLISVQWIDVHETNRNLLYERIFGRDAIHRTSCRISSLFRSRQHSVIIASGILVLLKLTATLLHLHAVLGN